MSKKNTLLALAVAAALAAPNAFAAQITETAVTVNSNQFDDNASSIVLGTQTVAATAADNYLGRTVGYNVRVRLTAGKIKTPPTITATGGAASASLVTGTGAAGSTEFVVRVVPNASGTQVGEGFTITGLEVDNLAALGSGGTLGLEGAVYDPTTAIELPGSSFSEVVVTAIQGVSVVFTPTGSPSVIDVGQPSAKRYFTANGAPVGSGTDSNLFNAGEITITNTPGVQPWLPGTGTADITITGENFAPFRTSTATGNTAAGIYLATDSSCSTKIGSNASISTDGKSATFTGVVLNTLDADETPAAAPFEANVCFDANSVTQIARQEIKGSAVVKPGAGFLNATSSVQSLASMGYNGPVVNVYHFNPASNMDQQSYLRITNTSGINGLVSIDATCDNGTKRPGTSFNLNAENSILLTSQELENGSASKGVTGIGSCGGGKMRLVVTGEFSSMEVQNFLRNINSAGTVNTNVNNED